MINENKRPIILGVLLLLFWISTLVSKKEENKNIINKIDKQDSLDKKAIKVFKEKTNYFNNKEKNNLLIIEKNKINLITNYKKIKNEKSKISKISIDSTFSLDSIHKLNTEYIREGLISIKK